MSNMFTMGYWIEREDGTRDHYVGWTLDEIRHLENMNHNNSKFVPLGKTYEIENSFLRWEYNEESGIFREYNDGFDEILELGTKNSIALHIWKMATERDEEDIHAVYLMASDIFGGYQAWRDAALIATLREFDKDEHFIMDFI